MESVLVERLLGTAKKFSVNVVQGRILHSSVREIGTATNQEYLFKTHDIIRMLLNPYEIRILKRLKMLNY